MTVPQLAAMLGQVSIRKKRKRRSGKNATQAPLAPVTVMVQPAARRRKRNRRKNPNTSQFGKPDMVITRREFWKPVKGADYASLGPEAFPVAKGFSAMFERFRFTKVMVEYVPSCASTQAGSVVFGVDLSGAISGDVKNMTMKMVSGLSGTYATHITKGIKFPMYLAGSDKYALTVNGEDASRLCFYSDPTNVTGGNLWATYSISFWGMKAP